MVRVAYPPIISQRLTVHCREYKVDPTFTVLQLNYHKRSNPAAENSPKRIHNLLRVV